MIGKKLRQLSKNFNVINNTIKLIENFFRFDNCPLCHSKEIGSVGVFNYSVPVSFSDLRIAVKNHPEYWRCHSCSSYFIQNIISGEKAKELYSNNQANKWNYAEFEKDKTEDLINAIRETIKVGDSVLDVGCNDGNFLNFAKKIGAKTFGVEFSQLGRKVCAENGHQVFASTNDVPVDLKFDYIFAFDLVEHLYNIKEFFESCRHLLKLSGRLVILTGNPNCLSAKLSGCKWWYINNPEHLIFPSKKYFTNYSGFKLQQYFSVFNSLGYYFISIYNLLKPHNILKIIAKLILHRYDGAPLLGKDHALIILQKI